MGPRIPVEERLETKLVRRPNGCIEFTGKLDSHGYGSIWRDGKLCLVHRVVWELDAAPAAARPSSKKTLRCLPANWPR